MQDRAKQIVVDYLAETFEGMKFSVDDVYVVWFCKTLQNWKALLSTDMIDGMYFEVTHNGDKNETYVDVYEKSENYIVKAHG